MASVSEVKITAAMRDWAKTVAARPDGRLPRFSGAYMTYVMAGKMRDAGLVTIDEEGSLGWPYGWKAVVITDKGREVAAQPYGQRAA